MSRRKWIHYSSFSSWTPVETLKTVDIALNIIFNNSNMASQQFLYDKWNGFLDENLLWVTIAFLWLWWSGRDIMGNVEVMQLDFEMENFTSLSVTRRINWNIDYKGQSPSSDSEKVVTELTVVQRDIQAIIPLAMVSETHTDGDERHRIVFKSVGRMEEAYLHLLTLSTWKTISWWEKKKIFSLWFKEYVWVFEDTTLPLNFQIQVSVTS